MLRTPARLTASIRQSFHAYDGKAFLAKLEKPQPLNMHTRHLFSKKPAPFLALMLAVLTPLPGKAAEIDENCEKQWIIDSGALLDSTGAMTAQILEQWQRNEATCLGSPVYWGRLALIQLGLNDLKSAKASINKAPNGDDKYGFVLQMAKIQLIVQERLKHTEPLTEEDIERFARLYQDIVNRYPHWPTGHAMLGNMLTLLGKHPAAIQHLQIASTGNAYELQSVYRSLAISFSAIGKHEEALSAGDKAVVRNRGLTGDPSFAYAMAISHTTLGYLEDAEDILKVIQAKRPEVKNDPAFHSAVAFFHKTKARSIR